MSGPSLAVSHPVIRDVLRRAAIEVPGVLRVEPAPHLLRTWASVVRLGAHRQVDFSIGGTACRAEHHQTHWSADRRQLRDGGGVEERSSFES